MVDSTRFPVVVVSVVLASGLACGCAGEGDSDGGSPYDGAETGGGDASADGGGDSGETSAEAGAADPGPISLVVQQYRISTKRLCDLDDDGIGDNVVADLGSPGAELLSAALDAAMAAATADVDFRLLAHLPWAEDRSVPRATDAVLALVKAVDVHFPPDGADDFSGEEPFVAHQSMLDPCGEPIAAITQVTIDQGEVSGCDGTFPLIAIGLLEGAELGGTVAPYGATGSLSICGALPIREAGATVTQLGQGLTALEILLAGGAALGLSGVPGVAADLDLDGDGLERFELDELGMISACIDGDSTVLAGRDCWADERMADAFALNLDLGVVGASLEGIGEHFWGDEPGACPDGPPEPSLWGPCPDPGEALCDRGESRECAPACGGEGRASCNWSCSGWTRCETEGSLSSAPESCADVVLAGDAFCDGDRPSVRLVSDASQVGVISLPERVTVGNGLMVVGASVTAALGATVEPGSSWSLAAWVDDLGAPAPGAPELGGADGNRRGYFMEWELFVVNGEGVIADDGLRVAYSDGSGETDVLCDEFWSAEHGYLDFCTSYVTPRLDAESADAAQQTASLIIVPDDPETEENEMLLASRIHNKRGNPAVNVACSGARCPETLLPGQELTISLSAATTDEKAALLDVALPEGLSVLVEGPCR